MLRTVESTKPIRGCGVAHFRWQSVLGELSASLWYPAWKGTGKTAHYLHILQACAEENATPDGGQWPLVLISHGAGGSRFDQYYLAESLSIEGYAVLTIDHRDIRKVQQRWQNLLTRPMRLLLAQQAFSMEALSERVNFSKTLLMGHSAGAYDVLVKCGCPPRFELVAELSPALTELSKFELPICRFPSPLGIILMAPALSDLFPVQSLNIVKIPAMIISAEQDAVRMLGTPANYAARLPNVIHHTLLGAGHYAFVYESPPILKAINPLVSGGDARPRKQLHNEIIGYSIDFCNRLCLDISLLSK